MTVGRQVAAAAAREAADEFSVEQILATVSVPGAAELIDRTKPIAMCMVLPEQAGAALESVYLVPATSGKEYADSVAPSGGTGTARIEGDYVLASASVGLPPAAKDAKIASALPVGDLVLRLDVARLCEHYRAVIDQGLGMVESQMESASAAAMGGVNMAPAFELYVDFFRAILDSGESFEVAVRLDGARFEQAVALTARAGSALAGYASKERTDARALARYVDPDASLSMVVGSDMVAMTKRFRRSRLHRDVSEPLRAGFRKCSSTTRARRGDGLGECHVHGHRGRGLAIRVLPAPARSCQAARDLHGDDALDAGPLERRDARGTGGGPNRDAFAHARRQPGPSCFHDRGRWRRAESPDRGDARQALRWGGCPFHLRHQW
jgi:hypothetical protein